MKSLCPFLNLSILPLFFAVAPLFNQCGTEDTLPPNVKNVTINDQTDDIAIAANDTLKFEAHFTDNIDLNDYQIVITPDFQLSLTKRVSIYPLEFKRFYNLGGTSTLAYGLVPIPFHAAEGTYHLQVNFEDRAGNKGEVIEKSFQILNNAPIITINHPENKDISLKPRDTIKIKGTVKSFGANLDSLSFTLKKPEQEPVFVNTLTANEGEISGQFHQFTWNQPVGSDRTGELILRVRATDKNEKFTWIDTGVIILE